MPKLTVTATIDTPVLTEELKRALCILLITQIMGREYVQKLSQQGQSKTHTAVEKEQRSISYA